MHKSKVCKYSNFSVISSHIYWKIYTLPPHGYLPISLGKKYTEKEIEKEENHERKKESGKIKEKRKERKMYIQKG